MKRVLLVLAACGHHAEPPSGPPTRLVLKVHDGATPVGARVLLFDADNQPLHFGSLDMYGNRQSKTACVLAPGVLGTWDGIVLAYGSAEVRAGTDPCTIPFGAYKVWAWRGVEYQRWEGTVDLSEGKGDVALDVPLQRAWTPHGTLSADLHVHAFASGDSLVPNPQRVVAQVAAGVQVIGLSDHNASGDLDAEIHELKLDDTVASIPSNELTSEQAHIGVYPVPVDRKKPFGGGPAPETIVHADPDELFKIAHAFPGNPIVQVNHPRFRVTALFDTVKWDGIKWPPPFPLAFDAVEVLAGYAAFDVPGDRRIEEAVRDFYTLTDHGHLIAPLGNSDVHNFNWVHDGLTRNYVFVDDPRTHPFDVDGFVAAIRHRRVVATSGPWLDVEIAAKEGAPTVGPGQSLAAKGSVWLDITVSQAAFVHVDQIRIVSGGRIVKKVPVPAGASFRWKGEVAIDDTDTWIGVDCGGDTPLPVEQTGSYQQEKWHHPGVTPFAIIGPVLIDVDGDGRWKRGDADVPL